MIGDFSKTKRSKNASDNTMAENFLSKTIFASETPLVLDYTLKVKGSSTEARPVSFLE